MDGSLQTILRNVGEGKSEDLEEIKKVLLHMIETTCYQEGSIERILENHDLCEETVKYAESIYQKILEAFKKDIGSGAKPSLSALSTRAGGDYKVWSIVTKRFVVGEKEYMRGDILPFTPPKSVLLEGLGVTKILRVYTKNDDNLKINNPTKQG
jgi:hypothetical protein